MLTEGVPWDRIEELRAEMAEDPKAHLAKPTMLPGSDQLREVSPGVLASAPVGWTPPEET